MALYSELSDRVHGPVLVRGEPGYDDELAGFQTGEPHRPDVVVGAQDAADVAAAVAFAAAHDLPVAVHATGHGRGAGLEGGVVISTRRMQGVRIYPDTGVAHIAAGARWAQVAEAAAEHGLAPLSGSFPAVGAVGYLLGGGLGLMGRRYGWAADHVRAIELVTADGVARRATADTEPELFWALRGGREPLAGSPRSRWRSSPCRRSSGAACSSPRPTPRRCCPRCGRSARKPPTSWPSRWAPSTSRTCPRCRSRCAGGTCCTCGWSTRHRRARRRPMPPTGSAARARCCSVASARCPTPRAARSSPSPKPRTPTGAPTCWSATSTTRC